MAHEAQTTSAIKLQPAKVVNMAERRFLKRGSLHELESGDFMIKNSQGIAF
ncbi:MAG: hypothetical protein HY298_17500 [Verrucomicrobia bacterium]|nr:hypothetical protein [Verrucomicrobiota bacterium]